MQNSEEKRPINRQVWKQKTVILEPIPTAKVGADEETASGYECEEEEFPAKYYAVCTNNWPHISNRSIGMCTYYEPLDCETLAEAMAAAKKMNEEGKKCPYCGHSHFRVKEGESLSFERKYMTRYFFAE